MRNMNSSFSLVFLLNTSYRRLAAQIPPTDARPRLSWFYWDTATPQGWRYGTRVSSASSTCCVPQFQRATATSRVLQALGFLLLQPQFHAVLTHTVSHASLETLLYFPYICFLSSQIQGVTSTMSHDQSDRGRGECKIRRHQLLLRGGVLLNRAQPAGDKEGGS